LKKVFYLIASSQYHLENDFSMNVKRVKSFDEGFLLHSIEKNHLKNAFYLIVSGRYHLENDFSMNVKLVKSFGNLHFPEGTGQNRLEKGNTLKGMKQNRLKNYNILRGIL
jgi:hypothetical protein